MGGLQTLCKRYGKMKVRSNGKTLTYVWDYAQDVAVLESEIPIGSQRWEQSERTRSKLLRVPFKEDGWSIVDDT